MDESRKETCRFFAEMVNAYRLVPRVVLFTYYGFFIYAWYFVVEWFMQVDWNTLPDDPIVGSVAAAAIAGFPAVILGILSKILKELTTSYWNGTPKVHDQ